RDVQQRKARAREHVSGHHLGPEVGAYGERRDPQHAVPADGSFLRDAGAARHDGRHGTPGDKTGHEVHGNGHAEDMTMPVRADDQQVQEEREHEREDEEADAAKRALQLAPQIQRSDHDASSSVTSAVSSRKASSRSAPRTSMSRARSYRPSNARNV